MNILVVTGIFPPDHGGPASYVPLISSELAARGHSVKVITLSDTVDTVESYTFSVVRIKRQQNRILRAFAVMRAIYSASMTADVVYLNGLVFEGVLASMIGRRPFAVKVVGDLIWERAMRAGATNRTLDQFQSDALPLRWRALRALQAWYTARANRVVVPSRYLGKIVSNWGIPEAKCVVVYNAVQRSPVTELTAPAFDVVSVGRLVPWKGMSELIQACGVLGLSLRIVGDGPLRHELAAEAFTANASVSFAGYVQHSQVANEIRNARVFVLNSTYEGLPHIVLEAKMLGVPVIATAAGGTGETITHGVDGWLVPVGNPEALQSALKKLLSDPSLLQRLAAAAHKQLQHQFSYHTLVEHTEKVLAEVAAEGAL